MQPAEMVLKRNRINQAPSVRMSAANLPPHPPSHSRFAFVTSGAGQGLLTSNRSVSAGRPRGRRISEAIPTKTSHVRTRLPTDHMFEVKDCDHKSQHDVTVADGDAEGSPAAGKISAPLDLIIIML